MVFKTTLLCFLTHTRTILKTKVIIKTKKTSTRKEIIYVYASIKYITYSKINPFFCYNVYIYLYITTDGSLTSLESEYCQLTLLCPRSLLPLV